MCHLVRRIRGGEIPRHSSTLWVKDFRNTRAQRGVRSLIEHKNSDGFSNPPPDETTLHLNFSSQLWVKLTGYRFPHYKCRGVRERDGISARTKGHELFSACIMTLKTSQINYRGRERKGSREEKKYLQLLLLALYRNLPHLFLHRWL